VSSKFRFQRLTADFKPKLKHFCCGNGGVDRYFHQFALVNNATGQSPCHILVETSTGEIAGFYTLSSGSIEFEHMPEGGLGHSIPKYPISTALIGYMGVNSAFQGQGLGKILVIDAIRKAGLAQSDIGLGILAVVADPIDSESQKFFEKMGFAKLIGKGSLFIPLKITLDKINQKLGL
jgi:GNAT superfamily N-acetyltransferase